ncbi:hypothetical protein N7467_004620 [Penicillium canescens]|nr:hypothetical protein N7467_004620 [Penicillium canescens]
MSPTPKTPQAQGQEPTGSNTESRMRNPINQQYKDEDQYQDHPDAPLPIESSKSTNERYSDHPEYEYENENEQDGYNCQSSSESQSDLENQALAQSEPRPIDDEYDDNDENQAAAGRPRHAWQILWLRNKGMALVLLAQMFGASMNVMTQILEIHSAMHPFQVLFARMSITALASYIYMYYASVPNPIGTRPVRPLLLLRAASGFMGVYGLYYSVQYLPLSEATVITFLAPIMTCYACSLLIPGETFSRRQQFAALVSLGGVVLIARPFGKREKVDSVTTAVSVWAMGLSASNGGGEETPDDADAYHHVLATVVAFVGVIGAAGAYTSIRMIGKRAHPLVSVTYFSTVTTVVSFLAMAFVPAVPFRLPSTVVEWSLLTGLGVCGFLLQFLLTAGLSYVPPASVSGGKVVGQGSKATSMVYMQMLFALFYDKVVWGVTLSGVSWIGSGLILICAVYVAVEGGKQTQTQTQTRDESRGGNEEYRDVEGYKDATEREAQEGVH